MFSKYNAISKGRMNVILKSILNEKRITRTRLTDLLKLSPASISKYIKTLMDMGLIKETEQEKSTGGRRSAYIELNPAAGLNIALVLSASHMQGVLINTVGEVMDEYSLPTYLRIPREDLLELLYGMLDKLFDNALKELQSEFDSLIIATGEDDASFSGLEKRNKSFIVESS